MSKSTKIIAALGVVAGLGVAALPMASYAADNQSATGNVDLYVEVTPAIAMTIAGNNDEDSVVEETGVSHNAVDAFNPAGMASGNLDGHTIPAASVTGISSSAWSMLPNSVKEGGEFKSTITVYTNSTTGYDLTVKDADETTALTQIVTGGTADTIDAIASAGSLSAGAGKWGYRVGTSGDWLPMPAASGTAANIGSESVQTDNGTEYTVEYGVATKADQATGIYKDSIIYTATTK